MIYQPLSKQQGALFLPNSLHLLLQQILYVKHEQICLNNIYYQQFVKNCQQQPLFLTQSSAKTNDILTFSKQQELLTKYNEISQIFTIIKPLILSTIENTKQKPKLIFSPLNFRLQNLNLNKIIQNNRSSISKTNHHKLHTHQFDKNQYVEKEYSLSTVLGSKIVSVNEENNFDNTQALNFVQYMKKDLKSKNNQSKVRTAKMKESKKIQIDDNYGLKIRKKINSKSPKNANHPRKVIKIKSSQKNTKIQKNPQKELNLKVKSKGRKIMSPMTPRPRLVHDAITWNQSPSYLKFVKSNDKKSRMKKEKGKSTNKSALISSKGKSVTLKKGKK